MAYLVEVPQCYAQYCAKRATHELKNRRNESMGFFCTPHGKDRLRDLNEMERASSDH